MARNTTKAALFSTWLRGQMIQNKLSNRALGKTIDPELPERGRRQVLRHLSGSHFPNRKTRASYVDAFNLDGDPFTDEEDEDQPMAAELAYLASRLKRLERRVEA